MNQVIVEICKQAESIAEVIAHVTSLDDRGFIVSNIVQISTTTRK